MKNRGFTLMEVLAVIVILGLLIGLGFYSVQKVIDKSKSVILSNQYDTILTAAYDYSLMHTSKLPINSTTPSTIITLAQLKNERFIETNIINPNTNEAYSDDLLIEISYQSTDYDETKSKVFGDYVYEIINNNTNDDNALKLNCGVDTVIDVNDTITESCTLENNDSVVSLYTLIKNYSINNTLVSTIDTSDIGIYTINYTAIYNTKVVTTTRKVVVQDTVAPSLKYNDDIVTTLSSDIISLSSNFDAEEGFSCSDNSGHCSVNVEGSVDTSKTGTYTIYYTAVDDAGNTSSKISKVITVQ